MGSCYSHSFKTFSINVFCFCRISISMAIHSCSCSLFCMVFSLVLGSHTCSTLVFAHIYSGNFFRNHKQVFINHLAEIRSNFIFVSCFSYRCTSIIIFFTIKLQPLMNPICKLKEWNLYLLNFKR